MGRNKKIMAVEVLEILANGNQETKAEIAKILGVTPPTVASRIRELREDGELIIHNGDGLILLSREMIENDEEMADAFRVWVDWIFRSLRNLIICAKPAQPLFPTLRRNVREQLTSDERKLLSQSCVKIKAMIDYAQADEEDQEK